MTLREVLEQLGMADNRSVFHFRYEEDDESEFNTGHYDVKSKKITALVNIEGWGVEFVDSVFWLDEEVKKAEVWCDRGRFEWTFILKSPKKNTYIFRRFRRKIDE